MDERAKLQADNDKLRNTCRLQTEELAKIQKLVDDGQLILLDYPVTPKPRFGHGQPLHPELVALLQARRSVFAESIDALLGNAATLRELPLEASDEGVPHWNNPWFNHADAAMLCTFLQRHAPTRLVEIGSGNSTMFARWAVTAFGLTTHITSIDPQPRAIVDDLCDEVVRKPLEDCDLARFESLGGGDIVFFDGSHRSLQNSDVTVFFLEVLPRLARGVIWHIHDIYLPADYPPEWKGRYYSEQYLLAAALLAGATKYEVMFANPYLPHDDGLLEALAPIADDPVLGPIRNGGGSFWLRMT
jgi:Methyltransferase domain